MAWFVGGTESLINIGGTELTWYVDGTMISQPIQWVDDLEHGDVGTYYDIRDTGQATLPYINSAGGWEDLPRLMLPSGNPNSVHSHPNTWGNQSSPVENYPSTGQIFELYWLPSTYSSASLFRIYMGGDGTDVSDNQLCIPFDGTTYTRIAHRDPSFSDGWRYYGDDPQENTSVGVTSGEWHRLVIDKSPWPDVDMHIWNASTGTHLTSLSTTGGSGVPNGDGFGFWFNGDTGVQISKMNLIDSNDI